MYHFTISGRPREVVRLDPNLNPEDFSGRSHPTRWMAEVLYDPSRQILSDGFLAYIPQISTQATRRNFINVGQTNDSIPLGQRQAMSDIFNIEEVVDESEEADNRPDRGFRLDRWAAQDALSLLRRRFEQGEEPSDSHTEGPSTVAVSPRELSGSGTGTGRSEWITAYHTATIPEPITSRTNWAEIAVEEVLQRAARERSAPAAERSRLQETDVERSERIRAQYEQYIQGRIS